MATARAAAFCKRCVSFVLGLGLTAFFFWLTLRVDPPKCYVKKFYVPALDKSLHTQNHVNSNVSFTLELENGNKDKGIRYDDVGLSFSIVDTGHKSPSSIGNATVAGFYQGKEKDAFKNSSFRAHGVNWTRVLKEGKDQKVVFRVDLVTAVKYKILFWFTKRHGLVRGANLEVNDSGLMVYPKGVKMESDAFKGGRGCCLLAVVGISVHLVHLIDWHS